MRYTIFLALVGAMASAPAVAAEYILHIQPAADQSERLEEGRQVVDSPGALVTVRIIPPKSATEKRSGVRVYVSNHGKKPFNFGPANITIELGDGTTVAMLTYNDLAREERRREGWQRFGVAMAAAGQSMNAANAGTTTSYGNYNGNTMGTIGTTPFNATTTGYGTVTTYDPARAQIAQAAANQENRANAAALAQAQANNRAAIDQVMQTTTVDPGGAFGGAALFDPPKAVKDGKDAVPVIIVIDAGGEQHHFAATLQKVK